jgi:hypothetical protein
MTTPESTAPQTTPQIAPPAKPSRRTPSPASTPASQIQSPVSPSGFADELLSSALTAEVEVTNTPDKVSVTEKQISDIVCCRYM